MFPVPREIAILKEKDRLSCRVRDCSGYFFGPASGQKSLSGKPGFPPRAPARGGSNAQIKMLRFFVDVHQKKIRPKADVFFRTRGRDRTGMRVSSLVFETSASTNSATRAFLVREGKNKLFLFPYTILLFRVFARPA